MIGSNGWYFILPTGHLYLWNGGAGAQGTLVATLGEALYENPSRLFGA